MLHSRRNLFKIGGGVFGAIVSGRKSYAVEVSLREEKQSREELAKMARIFEYGVASGDPKSDRVILWTRVSSDADDSVPVRWQVALDIGFAQIVSEGMSAADRERDFTIKVDALLPFAGTVYYYRFFAEDCWSIVGRTRTTPLTKQNVRLAVVSCSSIWSGYFNSYEAIARRNDLDAVVHLGDYIYDVPDPDELRNMPANVQNTLNPDSLEAVRQRYRYYRKDPQLRRAHQQHPWVIVWDNHDIENRAGKDASIRAFHEWTPIRSPDPADINKIYRRLSFGPMLDLIMLDTRHIGRNSVSGETGQASILGDEQFGWLKAQLNDSRSAQWRVIGNQILMAPCKVFGKSIDEKNWDGYPKDRERLLRYLAEGDLTNTLVVTGDSHLSYASNLEVDGRSVAVEFLPSSVTRGNLDEQVTGIFTKIAKGGFETAIKAFNSHIRYFESTRHGYGIVDLKSNGATLEYWYVPHQEQSLEEEMGRAMFVATGAQKITEEKAQATQSGKFAPPAPLEPRFFTSPGELGGTGGSYFNDEERLGPSSQVKSIQIRSGERVDAIEIGYADGQSWYHGGTGGQERELILEDQEYFRKVLLCLGKKKGTTSVHFIRFTTNLGRVLEGGVKTGTSLEFSAPEGRHIVGFRGRKGSELDKLGPIFAPDF